MSDLRAGSCTLCPCPAAEFRDPLPRKKVEDPMGSLFPSLPVEPVVLACALSRFSPVSLFATPGLPHARLPCPPPSPGVCSNSCLLSPQVVQLRNKREVPPKERRRNVLWKTEEDQKKKRWKKKVEEEEKPEKQREKGGGSRRRQDLWSRRRPRTRTSWTSSHVGPG